jgi:hypothetical protein
MPYDYEVLKNHIATAHPELLDAFLEGWNHLGPESQAYWHQQGLVAPKEKVKAKHWSSWTAVKLMELFASKSDNISFNNCLSEFEDRLAVLFHNSMQNSGQFFGLPSMPPLVVEAPDCLDGHYRFLTERHFIAKSAAKAIIYTELGKLLMKWKKDLGELGVDALGKAFSTAIQMKDDIGGKFDVEDFASDFDCDSDLERGP